MQTTHHPNKNAHDFPRDDLDRKLKRSSLMRGKVSAFGTNGSHQDRLLLSHAIATQLQDLKTARNYLRQRLLDAQKNRTASLAYARSASLHGNTR